MAHEAICKIDNCKICKELLRLKCENVQGLIGNENNRYSCVDSSRSLCEKDKLKSPCESLIRKNPSKLPLFDKDDEDFKTFESTFNNEDFDVKNGNTLVFQITVLMCSLTYWFIRNFFILFTSIRLCKY